MLALTPASHARTFRRGGVHPVQQYLRPSRLQGSLRGVGAGLLARAFGEMPRRTMHVRLPLVLGPTRRSQHAPFAYSPSSGVYIRAPHHCLSSWSAVCAARLPVSLVLFSHDLSEFLVGLVKWKGALAGRAMFTSHCMAFDVDL